MLSDVDTGVTVQGDPGMGRLSGSWWNTVSSRRGCRHGGQNGITIRPFAGAKVPIDDLMSGVALLGERALLGKIKMETTASSRLGGD